MPHMALIMTEAVSKRTRRRGEGGTRGKPEARQCLPRFRYPRVVFSLSPRPRVSVSPRLLLSALRPPLDVLLRHSGDGKRAWGHVLGNRGTRGDVRALADGDRRDELTVAAQEHPASHGRPVLVHPIVVAGDDSCADVRLGSDFRVSEVGQMERLYSAAQGGLLGLDEVAYPHVLFEHGLGTQARIGPDPRPR